MLQFQPQTWVLLFQYELALYYISTTISVLIVPNVSKWEWLTNYSGHGDIKSNDTPRLLSRLQVPKYWFWHFYAFGFILVMSYVYLLHSISWQNSVIQTAKMELQYSKKLQVSLVLYGTHMLRRLYESIRFRKSGSKMQITHYMLGYFFYSHTFLAIIVACLGNYEQYMSWKQGMGLALYVFGSVWQNASHEHLIAQKQQRTYLPLQKSGFRWIAGAHYFGEVVIYTGFVCIINHWILWLVYGWILVSMTNIATSYSETFQKAKTSESQPQWILFPFLY